MLWTFELVLISASQANRELYVLQHVAKTKQLDVAETHLLFTPSLPSPSRLYEPTSCPSMGGREEYNEVKKTRWLVCSLSYTAYCLLRYFHSLLPFVQLTQPRVCCVNYTVQCLLPNCIVL